MSSELKPTTREEREELKYLCARLSDARDYAALGDIIGRVCNGDLPEAILRLIEELAQAREKAADYDFVCRKLGTKDHILGVVEALREELKAARAVIETAQLFAMNASEQILESAREKWGNTNVGCALGTRREFLKQRIDYLARYLKEGRDGK